jgi:sarcosine oxidase
MTGGVKTSYDVIVVGLGAMGSASALELARRGRRVLGLDQHAPPHRLGSSHGRTRVIREAYFEHPSYVPLVRRAYERWADLEARSGRRLLQQTGGLMIGPPGATLVAGARRSAREYGIPHEELGAAEIRRRFPGHEPAEGMVGLLEQRAGLLFPEACLEAFLDQAREAGAVLQVEEAVREWRPDGQGIAVATDRGSYRAEQLVLAAGPWLPALLRDLRLPLVIERQLHHWFEPTREPERFRAPGCPVALWEYAPDRFFATLPDVGDGFKAGIHHEGEVTDPRHVRREPTAEDEAAMRALVGRFVPEANGRLREARVCLYTNTPDHDFLIDRHPGQPNVLVVSPCSGHGFKFTSAIGEVVADLVTTGGSPFDLTPFRIDRLLR